MARYESNISRIAVQCFPQPKMILLMLGRNHDKAIRPNRGFREIKVLRDASMANEQKFRFAKNGFNENVHDSGHSYTQLLIAHVHGNHPWLPGFYGLERFAFD